MFYIAAAHKSSGKTTISIGLSAALREQGLEIQTFKKGPDYIDPLWLGKASGKPCYNLDFYVDTPSEITTTFRQQSSGNDLVIVEGNKGLYDGLSLDGIDSNAALAELLYLPVLLVIDCAGITRGIAPLLIGYQVFKEPQVEFKGVILNKVGSSRHEAKLISAVDKYTDFEVLGTVGKSKHLTIRERHLGLVPGNEAEGSMRIINKLSETIAESVDLDKLAKKTDSLVPKSKPIKAATVGAKFKNLKIGIAQDEAFGFYYQADIDKFQELGAKIIYFSILHDKELPAVDGVFLGGGFPETHMRQIGANKTMLDDLAKKIESGLPVYAECGGMMILTNKIIWRDETAVMAGVIKADCVMSYRPYGRGYVQVKPTTNHLWFDSAEFKKINAHEFHYSTLENFGENYTYAYKVIRGSGIKQQQDGIIYKNLLANYTHFKNGENFSWIEKFLKFCIKSN